jgi:hypothetical protein
MEGKKKNWFLRHKIITGILVIIVAFGLIGAARSSQPTKVGNTNTPGASGKQETAKPTTQTYKIGDVVDLDGKTIVVNGVAPYTSNNQFLTPKAGNKFVSVDVTLANSSKDAFNYNVLNFRLQDDKDYTYSNAVSDQEPYLTTGAVQPGEKVRGFITYEIPNLNTPAKFIFTPGFLGTSQIIIDLTK